MVGLPDQVRGTDRARAIGVRGPGPDDGEVHASTGDPRVRRGPRSRASDGLSPADSAAA